jgi:hypothetical protein
MTINSLGRDLSNVLLSFKLKKLIEQDLIKL